MKWIILLLLVAAGWWAYNNVDFANLGSNTKNTIRNEKTIKKFFDADRMNKEETQNVLEEF